MKLIWIGLMGGLLLIIGCAEKSTRDNSGGMNDDSATEEGSSDAATDTSSSSVEDVGELKGDTEADTQSDAETETATDKDISSDPNLGCDGCLVADKCIQSGETNPDNVCQICSPELDMTGWSGNHGANCDDGAFCTSGDKCDGAQCVGAQRNCSDEIACNGVETCDETSRRCVPGEVTCSENTFCDAATDNCESLCTGCLINNVCYANNFVPTSDPCSICDTRRSKSSWSPNAGNVCDDGVSCTEDDICDMNGTCTGIMKPCNDTLSCTIDSCAQGQCVHTVMASTCQIDATCFSEGDTNPENSCQVCNASANNEGWSPKPLNTDCDDNLWCNGWDRCNALGSCSTHEFQSGNRCTDNTGCNSTVCNELADNCFADVDQICDTSVVYRCSSSACGSDVQQLTTHQFCSGASSSCDGRISESGWDTSVECAADAACDNSLGGTPICMPSLECGCLAENNFFDVTTALCWENPSSVELFSKTAAIAYCQNKSVDLDSGAVWRLPSASESLTLMRGCVNGESADGMTEVSCYMEPESCTTQCTGRASDNSCDYCLITEGPDTAPAGCYWREEMSGPCGTYWTDDSSFYAHYDNGVVDYAWTGAVDSYVRCVRD